jgi:hypothetical protein
MVRKKKNFCSVVDPGQDPHDFAQRDLDTGGPKKHTNKKKVNKFEVEWRQLL